MIYSQLGRTALNVSLVGLGTATPSQLGLTHGGTFEDAERLIHVALDHGVNFIDTAPAYGTEHIVGRAIKGRRDKVIVATKTLRNLGIRAGWRTLAERTAKNIDKSLKELGVDHIDLYQLHHISPNLYHGFMPIVGEVLVKAKEAGKIRYIGITEVSEDLEHRMLRDQAIPSGFWDTVMFDYHRQRRGAQDFVIPTTFNRGIGSIVMRANHNDRPDKYTPLENYSFAAGNVLIDTVLVGTGSADHLIYDIGVCLEAREVALMDAGQ